MATPKLHIADVTRYQYSNFTLALCGKQTRFAAAVPDSDLVEEVHCPWEAICPKCQGKVASALQDFGKVLQSIGADLEEIQLLADRRVRFERESFLEAGALVIKRLRDAADDAERELSRLTVRRDRMWGSAADLAGNLATIPSNVGTNINISSLIRHASAFDQAVLQARAEAK